MVLKVLEVRAKERDAVIYLARRYARRLAKRLGPLIAYLIGSYARGDFNEGSDIDILIVSDVLPVNPLRRMEVLYSCVLPGIEPRGYTHAEFARLLEKGDPAAREAVRVGVMVSGENSDAVITQKSDSKV